MDVNGTRFHLVYRKDEWIPAGEASPPETASVEWDSEEASVHLGRLLFRFGVRRSESPPGRDQRRGAGRDRNGNWYWIGRDRDEIRTRGHEETTSWRWWPAEPAPAPPEPDPSGRFHSCPPVLDVTDKLLSGLAVTQDHFLVTGLLRPKGVSIFDLHAGGPPLWFPWPAAVPFAPFDLSPRPGGGAWILDRENKRLWALDRYFRVVAPAPVVGGFAAEPDFVPSEGPALRTCAPPSVPFSLDQSWPVAAVDPVSVEGLPDGSVLILDSPEGAPFSRVHHLPLDGTAGTTLSLEHALPGSTTESGEDVSINAHDVAFVPGASAGDLSRVYFVDASGNQGYAFEWVPSGAGAALRLIREYLPMRTFGGRGLVAADGRPHYDIEDRWVPLAEQPRPRYRPEASLVLPTASAGGHFDGKEPGCLWHRLFVEACIPSGADVRVLSRAADHAADLKELPWQSEPPLYRRGDGPEIPYYRPFLHGTSERTGTWELLFQKAKGRFLQLRLELRGTGRNTPRLQALRVYYPRFSYLKEYLPSIYREDETSASFVERYLANPEGLYSALEGRIAEAESLFDPRLAPPDFLDWLLGWFGVTSDPAWDEQARRLFLRHAGRMFRERGTRAGMVRALRLVLDRCKDESIFAEESGASHPAFGVRIVERFMTRRAPGVLFGDPTEIFGPGSTSSASKWQPSHGAGPLHEAFGTFLAGRYGTLEAMDAAWGTSHSSWSEVQMPGVRPPPGPRADDWERFVRGSLGFTYAVPTDADEPLYRDFLARRYPQAADLNRAYALAPPDDLSGFQDVPEKLWVPILKQQIPSGGEALQDWILFVSVVLPTHRSAHRFTVLIPVGLDTSADDLRRDLDLARRIVDHEKPAHTDFEVKPYWALFRVGETRLEFDTLLDAGSRFAALVLGKGALAEGFLGVDPPWDARDRLVVGRDSAADERNL